MSFDDSVNIERKVAELFIVRASGHLYDSQRQYPEYELTNLQLKRLLEKGVGGVIILGGSVFELQKRCDLLRDWAGKPLLLCADIEEGVGQRFEGGSSFLPPLGVSQIYSSDANKAILLARKYGNYLASQAKHCGLNWILAPVCDINTNKLNPVINMRSWGGNPEIASKLACSFQQGVLDQGILSCLKHFPGHGDTHLDSHLDLPVVHNDLKSLYENELIPFIKGINLGADSVMTSHILFSNIDSEYPCTLSKKIITDLLRTEIGFEGLIVSDALIMKAITNKFGSREAALLAFEAGVDLIMMPEDTEDAIKGIYQAIVSGRISINRLNESLNRRNMAMKKIHCTSESSRYIEDFESEEIRIFSQELILSSIKKVNFHTIEPVKFGNNLLRSDFNASYLKSKGSSPAMFMPEDFGYKTLIVNDHSIPPWKQYPSESLDLERFPPGPFLLQLFIRGNPFSGCDSLREPWQKALKQLQDLKRLSALVVYGSPYLWDDLIQVLDPSIPGLYSPGQMHSVQQEMMDILFDSNQYSANSSLVKEFTD